ncbi:MAG: glycosyltransferase [Candidatus Thorarchaeota archaeon]|nr:glycosyltransferase [Candidatus Thorarchaeota archaeon]
MRDLLFLSHNIRHPRCEYLVRSLCDGFNVVAPRFSMAQSNRLSLSSRSASNMFNLGLSAMVRKIPMHLDGIDVFITPFMRNATFVHDYHVPLVPELIWLGYLPVAAIARALLPDSIRQAKAIISPNWRMLSHASEYARLPDFYVVPNYPLKRFYIDISIEKARLELDLPQDKQIVLFVGGGRLREIYGIDLLIDAWREVHRQKPDARLYILGPKHKVGLTASEFKDLAKKELIFPGTIPHKEIPIWIASADLCVSQRTRGFPVEFYNIYDSLKLSEYALFEKPIVAAGYSPGKDYISTDTRTELYARGIVEGLNGGAPKPIPHYWEENIPTLKKAYEALQS